jgi:acyl transferase domain-containing protein/acyl-CoA synthetase (AMP-forming)/AMP-acid ligase II
MIVTPAFSTLLAMMTTRATAQASAPAFTYLHDGEIETVRLTYGDLDRAARSIGVALQRAGMQGERALMLYSSSLDFVTAFLGCLYAGVIAVPAYPPKANQSFSRLLGVANDAAPRLALTTASLISNLHRRAEQTARFPALQWLATDTLADNDPAAWTPPSIDPSHLAFLQYTSGSTGTAKGVMVSHANLMHNLEGLRLRWEMAPESVMVTWLPTFHDLGLVFGVLEPLYTATHCVMMSPTAFVQRPLRWLTAISRYRATHSLAPNFAYELASKIAPAERATLDLRSWRMALNAAEPVREVTIRRFTELFAPQGFHPNAFCPAYGLAEGTLHVSGLPMPAPPAIARLDPLQLGANRLAAARRDAPSVAVVGCGLPAPGVRIVIVEPESRVACGTDAVGEIWLGGESVAQGYWRRPDATAETFQATLSSGEGPLLRTGDLGFLRDGQLFITGRLKDLIIIRGQNHYPQDIELTAEQSHPALRPGCSAAFSMFDVGEEQVALVVEVERTALRRLPSDEVIANIRRAVADEHELQVHAIALVKPATIPKTSSGKIQRRACRDAFLGGALEVVAEWRQPPAAAAGAPLRDAGAPLRDVGVPLRDVGAAFRRPDPRTRDGLRAWIIERMAKDAGVPIARIDPAEPFSRYGMDSVAAVTLAEDLHEWLGRPVPAGIAYDYPNINALVDALVPGTLPADPAPPADAVAGDEGVAIIGMACRFPRAESPEAFWELLRDGVDAVGLFPESRARLEVGADSISASSDVRQRLGAFLEDVDRFDEGFFGLSPREAMSMDPQQRLLLETSWEALERAGIAPASVAGQRAGVFIGISSNDYSRLQFRSGSGTDAWSGTGNAASIAANRLSYLFDLRGPSVAIDTACSSSLVAVHMACQSLRLGESELAIAGGVSLILSPEWSKIFASAQMLAPDGRCKTFDASADGYVRGEGCGVVLLKPLARAMADGDRVLAIIRGTAVNQDGRSHGLTAPNGPAQQDVVSRALADARLHPEQISYVEAHGTGTALGDPIELEALSAVLGRNRTGGQPLRIGSVKTNIGHLEAAAGIAGLFKVVLALQHRLLPPHLHFNEPTPHFNWQDAPVEVVAAATPLDGSASSLYAGVSAFGFGGTNAHVIVESGMPPPATETPFESGRGLLLLSARSTTALRTLAAGYARTVAAGTAPWGGVCATAARGRAHFAVRAAVAADTAGDAGPALAALAAAEAHEGVWLGEIEPGAGDRLAMIYPGQGSQWWGMGRELFASHPVYRGAIERCAAALGPVLPVSLIDVLYGSQGETLLDRTEYAQPAGFAVAYALTQLWESLGVRATAVVGHSVGEFAAAVAAGVLDVETACRLAAVRGRLMQPLGGRMAVVLASEADVRALAARYPGVVVAAINGPAQIVVSGPADAIQALAAEAVGTGLPARLLQGAHAFHSPLMEPMQAEWHRETARVVHAHASRRWVSTVSGREMDAVDASYWVTQVREPVLYAAAIAHLWTQGYRAFLEVGPSAGLASAGAASAKAAGEGLWLTGLRRGRPEVDAVRQALGQLYVGGARVEWRAWDLERRARVALPTYPFERTSHWVKGAVVSSPDIAAPLDPAYEVQWEELPAPAKRPDTARPATAWVVCGGSAAETMALVAAGLRTRGAVVAEPAVDEPSLLRALDWARAHGLAGVVHIGGFDAPAGDTALSAEVVQQTIVDGCLSVATVVRALDARPVPGVRLWIVTRGAVAVGADDRGPAVLQASLWGLGKVVAVEHPELWGGMLDLDPQSHHPVRDLIDCLPATPYEDQLAVRAGRIHAARLTPSRRLAAVTDPAPLRSDATYLITGGTGGLGLKVATRLVAGGARSVALVSRRGDADNPAARVAIEAMERSGATVRVFAADVAREQELAAVLGAIEARGLPLRGIVHAAGVLADGLLLSLDRERFERVCRPKIAGAWNLHRLTRHTDLDFFVLFSSAASLVGSAGQANYAAANAFMDALAVSRSMSGLPALAVNWGVWTGRGLGGRLDATHLRRLASLGFSPIGEEEGLRAFDRILSLQGQIALLRADWRRYAAAYPRTSMVRAYAPARDDRGADANGWLRDSLRRAAPGDRHDLIVGFVRAQAGAVLRTDPAQVALRRGFFDQGMDSLLAMELKQRLDAALGEALPATITFDHPTVETLAAFLLTRSLAAGDDPPAVAAGPAADPSAPEVVTPDAIDEIRKLSPEELEALIDREIDALLP